MRNRLTIRGHTIEMRQWPRTDPFDSLTLAQGEPTLVLLHEGLGSVSMWRDFPQQLSHATSRSVMAYSRHGHGDSDPPPTPHTTRFMHEEAETWLPALLDAAAIERAILLGHSDGGSIALIFAALFPERVTSLVLEAPHVFVEDVSIASISAAKTRYETGDLRARLAKHHRDVEVAFSGWSNVWLDPAFRTWNLEECLPRITCPVLLIQGEEDEFGTLRQVEAIASQISSPVETLILPNCGHSPHRDQPEAVLSAIARFVARESTSHSTAE